jgi:hypothetical protein
MVFSHLWKMKAYRDLIIAATIQAFTAYGITQWMPSFFIRTYGLGTAEVGLYLGLTIGIRRPSGNLPWRMAGGITSERAVCAGMACRSRSPDPDHDPVQPFCLQRADLHDRSDVAGHSDLPDQCVHRTGLRGRHPDLLPPAMRAMAAAILLFVLGLVGQGGGPVLIGTPSDAFAPTSGGKPASGSARRRRSKVFAVWRFYVAGRSLEARLSEGAASGRRSRAETRAVA